MALRSLPSRVGFGSAAAVYYADAEALASRIPYLPSLLTVVAALLAAYDTTVAATTLRL